MCSQLGHDYHITGLGDQVGHGRMRGGVTAVWTRLIEAEGFVKLTSVRPRYQYEAAVAGMHVAEIEESDDEIAVAASTLGEVARRLDVASVLAGTVHIPEPVVAVGVEA